MVEIFVPQGQKWNSKRVTRKARLHIPLLILISCNTVFYDFNLVLTSSITATIITKNLWQPFKTAHK